MPAASPSRSSKQGIIFPVLSEASLAELRSCPPGSGNTNCQKNDQDTKFYVRQVSLRYRNPGNRPDQYEAEQLQKFSGKVVRENYGVVKANGKEFFRYMQSMVAEKSCLTVTAATKVHLPLYRNAFHLATTHTTIPLEKSLVLFQSPCPWLNCTVTSVPI